MTINTLVQPQELLQWITQNKQDLIILEAVGGPNAYQDYLKEHLKGAVYVDMHDLASKEIDPKNGGRHPLPCKDEFSLNLKKWAVQPSSTVVIYDRNNGANAASRLWWMLQSIGHSQCFVLDGGFQGGKEIGIKVNNLIPELKQVEPYPIADYLWPRKTLSQVIELAKSKDHIVVDVRQRQRYQAIHEPIDLIAGHIPGAINLPFEMNLQDNGRFLSPKQLKSIYELEFEHIPIENITIHCGSGVTACHTILALAHSGLGLANLYVGSWSEYSRQDLPIATK
ncbi:sulfurtransferase [Myroides sp. LJL119]